MSEAHTLGEESAVEEDERGFPWSFVDIIKKPKAILNLLFSFYFLLSLMLCICIVCIVVGSIYFGEYGARRMLTIAFIVQGSCGLFVVLVHISAKILGWTSSKTVDEPSAYGQFIWIVMTLTNAIAAFCFAWFFISHIWFVKEFHAKDDDNYGYGHRHNNTYGPGFRPPSGPPPGRPPGPPPGPPFDPEDADYRRKFDSVMFPFTIVIFIVHYIVGICLILQRLWHSPRVLSWLKEEIQICCFHPSNNQVSQNNNIPNIEQPTNRDNTVENGGGNWELVSINV